MFRLGITGSIGSGKTTVSRCFESKGARLSISDDLAREILFSDPSTMDELIQYFGNKILDENGKLDRQNLADVAFTDPDNQSILNKILHPRVRVETRELMNTAEQEGVQLFVVDAPLIFEAGLDKELNAVLVVTASDDLRQQRVLDRSGISAADFARRDALQLSQDEKCKRADYIIENDSSLEALVAEVDRIQLEILERIRSE